jgi:hypothetical protein
VFRLPRTPRDVLRPFLQVGGSPFDSVRRRSTYRIRMACKRSGVRIPVAPPQVRCRTSNTELTSNLPGGGIPRGRIRPWDGCLSSSRVKFDQVGHANSALCDVQEVTRVWITRRHTLRTLRWSSAQEPLGVRLGPVVLLAALCRGRQARTQSTRGQLPRGQPGNGTCAEAATLCQTRRLRRRRSARRARSYMDLVARRRSSLSSTGQPSALILLTTP